VRSKQKYFISIVVVFLIFSIFLLQGCGKKATTLPESSAPLESAPQQSEAFRVLLVIANSDFQDREYDAVRNILSESGCKVMVSNSSGNESVGVNGTRVKPDLVYSEARVSDFECLVLIGGPGAKEYFEEPQLRTLVRNFDYAKRVVGAICIAPVILANAGLLKGKRATVWPDERQKLVDKGAIVEDVPVQVDGNIVTANGPDAAQEFARKLVEVLKSSQTKM